MDQLSGVDAGFLALETGRTVAHIGLLTVFDPLPSGPLTADDVRGALAARLHLMPPLRRRIAEVPFGLDRPYWFEDPDFDLDFHVRRVGIPAPGRDDQLAELVARLHSRPLDRARPLWELYVIEGLPGGRTAQYTKIHSAAVDAVTGVDLMTALLDTSPEPREVPPPPVAWSPDRRPSAGEMLTRALVNIAARPRRALGVAGPLTRTVARTASQQVPQLLDTTRQVLERVPVVREIPIIDRLGAVATDRTRPGVTAPRTSFSQRISQHRKLAFTSLDFDVVHRVHAAFGVTVNDVVVAVCAGALREYLRARHELPTDPLLALVPLTLRETGPDGRTTTRVSGMVTVLPTDEPDPLRRLTLTAAALEQAQRSHDAVPASLLTDVSRFASPALASLGARVAGAIRVADVANPPFNLVITNVPGPQQPLWCAGAKQIATYSLPVISDGVGWGMTAMSYDGRIHVAAVACRELMPDVGDLVEKVPPALDELDSIHQKGSTHDRTA